MAFSFPRVISFPLPDSKKFTVQIKRLPHAEFVKRQGTDFGSYEWVSGEPKGTIYLDKDRTLAQQIEDLDHELGHMLVEWREEWHQSWNRIVEATLKAV